MTENAEDYAELAEAMAILEAEGYDILDADVATSKRVTSQSVPTQLAMLGQGFGIQRDDVLELKLAVPDDRPPYPDTPTAEDLQDDTVSIDREVLKDLIQAATLEGTTFDAEADPIQAAEAALEGSA